MLPNGKEAARKLKVQAARFVLIKDILYKRGFSRLYLRCLGPEEADYVMREVHEGIYGNHSGARSLVHKLIRVGYYWPTMQKDQGCQYRTGGRTGLATATIYFGYRSIPVYCFGFTAILYIYIYIYICVCVCVCVCMCVYVCMYVSVYIYIIINIKVYHKTFP